MPQYRLDSKSPLIILCQVPVYRTFLHSFSQSVDGNFTKRRTRLRQWIGILRNHELWECRWHLDDVFSEVSCYCRCIMSIWNPECSVGGWGTSCVMRRFQIVFTSCLGKAHSGEQHNSWLDKQPSYVLLIFTDMALGIDSHPPFWIPSSTSRSLYITQIFQSAKEMTPRQTTEPYSIPMSQMSNTTPAHAAR